MRYLTLILLFIPYLAFSQVSKEDDLVINPLEEFKPEIANLIERIEYSQDTLHNFNHYPKVYAEITRKDGLDKLYSIGTIGAFQTSKNEITYKIKVVLTNGNIYERFHTVKIGDLIYPAETLDYDYADYDSSQYDSVLN
jgi:hypothetical protein